MTWWINERHENVERPTYILYVTKKIQSENHIFRKLSEYIQFYFFKSFDIKVVAPKQTLFDVHRWSKS